MGPEDTMRQVLLLVPVEEREALCAKVLASLPKHSPEDTWFASVESFIEDREILLPPIGYDLLTESMRRHTRLLQHVQVSKRYRVVAPTLQLLILAIAAMDHVGRVQGLLGIAECELAYHKKYLSNCLQRLVHAGVLEDGGYDRYRVPLREITSEKKNLITSREGFNSKG